MNVDEIRKFTSEGFQPFTLYLSDGRVFDIPHPDFIAVSRKAVAVVGKDELIDHIDPLHIVSVKPRAVTEK